jgi:cytochrome c nitrite reductase small subunit
MNKRRLAWAAGAFGISGSGIALSLLIGTSVGAGGYTFYQGKGWSYLSNDPRACVNCHIMREQYDGWQKASHHAVATCNDCHVPHDLIGKYLSKAENGFWHSKGFTLQDFHEPIQIRAHNLETLRHNCIDCHRDLVQELVGEEGGQHSGTLHSAHGGESNCIHCHRDVGHGPTR